MLLIKWLALVCLNHIELLNITFNRLSLSIFLLFNKAAIKAKVTDTKTNLLSQKAKLVFREIIEDKYIVIFQRFLKSVI